MSTPFGQVNRERWNELAALHARSEFYDLDGFRAGKETLRPLEVAELGDVTGKTLLHLQCHLGLDSLSWARRGACVTAVDYAEAAVAAARDLARELDLPAEFVCADVNDLPQVLTGNFDIVFTSYGVLCWLPDLRRWAEVIAHFLKPGGTFYMVETHPFANVFDDRPGVAELRAVYPYFHKPEPDKVESRGSYADRGARVEHATSYQWTHGLGEILSALTGAGLRLEFVHEFPESMFGILPGMARQADGWWRLNEGHGIIPLLFSVKCSRDARRSA